MIDKKLKEKIENLVEIYVGSIVASVLIFHAYTDGADKNRHELSKKIIHLFKKEIKNEKY